MGTRFRHGTPRMSGNALGIPRGLGGTLPPAFGYYLRALDGEGGGHDSPMAITVLPRPGDTCRSSGQGGAASGVLFTATEAAPCAERYSRSRRSIAFQTFSGSAPSDVSSLTSISFGAVLIAWKRLTSGVSSITVPKASGRSLTSPASSVWKERVSLVRPTTRMAGRGLAHGQASGLRVTESPWS
jgi:hypothetical protein